MSEHSELPNEPLPPSATDAGKLIPEWKVKADDQVILAGVLVFLLLIGGFGVSRLMGDDTDESAVTTEDVRIGDGDDNAFVAPPFGDAEAEADADAEDDAPPETAPAEPAVEEAAPETAPPVEEPVEEPVETTARDVDLEPAVAASIASFARVNGSVDGTTAVLDGYVDDDPASESAEAEAAAVEGITEVDNQLVVISPNLTDALSTSAGVSAALADGAVTLTGFVDEAADSTSARAAAAAVDGVVSVDNQLVAVQPGAVAALEGAGVSGADAVATDLGVVARGELPEESARQGALDAVAAVAGVASVTDELTVAAPDVSASLNALVELEPVQFATSSPVVLDSSFPTLDRAAEIILGAKVSGTIEVQGYTDIRGNEASNLTLSDGRAAAVVEYLVNAGVAPEQLASVGFGGTTQFGEGDSDEAFAANRRVVFVLQDAG